MTNPLKPVMVRANALDAAGLRQLAVTIFDDLRRIGADGIGISRDSYGAGEQQASDYCRTLAEREDLPWHMDAAANLVVELAGRDSDTPFVICGSHLDSVPQGGNFDGAAGVVAALLALVRLKRAGAVPRQSIRALAWCR